jgi:two-component system sensor histidine kinase HydH
VRGDRRRRIFPGRSPDDAMPPPGHREIQHEELSRLFGRMAGARLVALPPILGFAVWLAFVEPTAWRRIVLAAAVTALVAFFVLEWVSWRRRGFTRGAVPRNLSVAVLGSSVIVFATGGLASPFLYLTVVLGIIVGVFVPSAPGAALLAAQVASGWLYAWVGATGAVPEFNLAAFGGGDRIPVPIGYLVAHAVMLTFVYVFALAAGRTIRGAFERIVARGLAAQEESLRAHAERAEELTALSGEIAHELKNPLASVKGLAGLLAQHLPDGKGAERLLVLRREVDRMQSVLQEFLEFSRPLVPLALGDADVAALCREVAALHEGMARDRGVEVSAPPGEVRVRCDPRKVKQVLINLVQNALDASPAGAAVELEARAEAGGARVTVLDRGRGVDPALAAAVFSPGVTTKPAGSGLGLTIARALARQHGGDLELAPRSGGGTRAELRLPAAAPAGDGRAA